MRPEYVRSGSKEYLLGTVKASFQRSGLTERIVFTLGKKTNKQQGHFREGTVALAKMVRIVSLMEWDSLCWVLEEDKDV